MEKKTEPSRIKGNNYNISFKVEVQDNYTNPLIIFVIELHLIWDNNFDYQSCAYICPSANPAVCAYLCK